MNDPFQPPPGALKNATNEQLAGLEEATEKLQPLFETYIIMVADRRDPQKPFAGTSNLGGPLPEVLRIVGQGHRALEAIAQAKMGRFKD